LLVVLLFVGGLVVCRSISGGGGILPSELLSLKQNHEKGKVPDNLYQYFRPIAYEGFSYEPVYLLDESGAKIEVLSETSQDGVLSPDGTKVLFVHPDSNALPLCGSGMWNDIPRAHNNVSVLDLRFGRAALLHEEENNVNITASWSLDGNTVQITTVAFEEVHSRREDPNEQTESAYPCLESTRETPGKNIEIELAETAKEFNGKEQEVRVISQ
jgi:hypothetical protein